MIEFKNITKKFDQREIVSNISFTIEKGELVVLIGPSGCGKTTLLKIINRLIQPSSGEVFINGESTSQKDEIELRRNIGYVIQQTGLFPHMTVRENIEIIPHLQKMDKNAIVKKSIDLMTMVGLEPEVFLDRYPSQLSGGQQQRVGVARAFACDPDIILMDEPFSALDPLTRSQLQDELVDLNAKMHKTIVFVTHDMDEAVKIADKICIVNSGSIIQYDTVENIMKNPINDFVADFIGKYRIWSSPELIKAKDIMLGSPVYAFKDTPVFRCVDRMRERKVDSLFVTEKDLTLAGVVNAKDIRSNRYKDTAVEEIMHKDFDKVTPDINIVEILYFFNDNDVSAIPVVDENNILCGVITKGSLLTTLSQQYLDTPEVM